MTRVRKRNSRNAAASTLVVILAATNAHLACRVPSNSGVIAEYRGGRLLAGELDATIVDMPASRRNALNGADFDTWEGLAREIVMNRLLAARAEIDGLSEDQRFLKRAEDELKRDTVNLCLDRISGHSDPPGDSEIRRFLTEHVGQFDEKERRLVSQIYLPLDPATSKDDLLLRAERLRVRFLAGESFESLAREYSQSETSIQGGLIGWFEEQDRPNDLSRLIFALEPEVVSEPVVSSSGVHLFMVTSVRSGRIPTEEEMRDRAAIILTQQQRDAETRAFLESWEDPPGSFVVDGRELTEIANFGSDDTEIYRIGETAMSVEKYRDYLRETAKKTEREIDPDFAGGVYRTLVFRERLFQHCLATGTIERDEIDARFETRRDQILTSLQRQSSLRALALENREAIDSFFDRRWRRFAGEVELDLEILAVPIGDEPLRQQTELSVLGRQIVSREIDIDDAATRIGGRADRLGRQSYSRIVGAYPKLGILLASAEPGDVTSPIVVGTTLVIAVVTGRTDPMKPTFDEVADEVADAYVVEHRQELYAELERRWLADVRFRINEDALRAAIAATKSGADPLPEEGHE